MRWQWNGTVKEKEPGRLIPVPGTISAGCGLAWCVLPQEREHLLKVMEEGDITPQAVHEMYVIKYHSSTTKDSHRFDIVLNKYIV